MAMLSSSLWATRAATFSGLTGRCVAKQRLACQRVVGIWKAVGTCGFAFFALETMALPVQNPGFAFDHGPALQ